MSFLQKLDDEARLVIRNALIESSFSLPTRSHKIFKLLLERLLHVQVEPTERIVSIKFTAKDIEAVTDDSRTFNMKKMVEPLVSTTIHIPFGDSKGEIMSLVPKIQYDSNEMTFTATLFAEQISLYTDGYYTEYKIKPIFSFTCNHSFRIFDLVMQYKNTAKEEKGFFVWSREISIADLHFYLQSSKTYKKRFNAFKEKVLEPSRKDINAHPDIKFDYSEKRGKYNKLRSITFHVKMKKETPLHEEENAIDFNHRLIRWLKDKMNATESQLQMCWDYYLLKGRDKELEEIWSHYNKKKEEGTANNIGLFWHIVKEYINTPFAG